MRPPAVPFQLGWGAHRCRLPRLPN